MKRHKLHTLHGSQLAYSVGLVCSSTSTTEHKTALNAFRKGKSIGNYKFFTL
uniref:Uncharacterized protein n=1 Tax=Anguilla anguilla TaxID=7936 RepID=A0A0E9X7R1_ANGAN